MKVGTAALREHDLGVCRRFAAKLLRWYATEQVSPYAVTSFPDQPGVTGNVRDCMAQLARDLEAEEVSAVGLVEQIYDQEP